MIHTKKSRNQPANHGMALIALLSFTITFIEAQSNQEINTDTLESHTINKVKPAGQSISSDDLRDFKNSAHVEDVNDLLFKTNRKIQSVDQAYRAALEKVKTKGVLPDPMIENSFFLNPIETRNGPMENQLMLGQKFPLWGKLKRNRLISVLQAENAGLKLENTKVNIVYQLNMRWSNYLKLRESLAILEQYNLELESFRKIALIQYSTGTGMTQHPILKLQIESSLIETKINTLESKLATKINELQALFDGSFSPALFPVNWDILVPSRLSQEWLNLAREANPVFQITRNQVMIATIRNELAVRQNYPDLITGLTYTVIGPRDSEMSSSSGADALGVKVGLNLPIWWKRNKARVESSQLLVKASAENSLETWNQIEEDIYSTQKELEEIVETYRLYEGGLVQESDQMLASAFSAYETGKISFLDLLDSERMVVKVRLEFESVKADRRIAAAKLMKAVGLTHFNEE